MNLIWASLVVLGLCLMTTDAQNVPVLMLNLNTKGSSVPIGHSLKSADFYSLVKSGLKQTEVDLIVFDQLADQNIRHQLPNKNAFIENSDSFEYQPSVEEPYQTLLTFFSENPQIKVNIINDFDDVNAALDFMLAKNNPNPIILTGKKNIEFVSRERRDVQISLNNDYKTSNASNNTVNYIYGTSDCLAEFGSMYIVFAEQGTLKRHYLNFDESRSYFNCDNGSNGTETYATLNIAFDEVNATNAILFNEIKLTFIKASRSWKVGLPANSTADKNDMWIYTGQPYGLETPLKFSFACSKTKFQYYFVNTTTLSPDYALFIDNFQFQPFGVTVKNDSIAFGQINYCKGFITSGIWMMLVVTLSFVLLVSCGMSFLGSIQMADRFEDPKGKTISVAIEK